MPAGDRILPVGNQAFRALADALDFPGSLNLTDVDISVATPVVDLTRMMEAKLVDVWTLARFIAFVAADDQVLDMRPQEANDWTQIFRWSQEDTQRAVPPEHDIYVVGFGVRLDPNLDQNLNFLAAWLVREIPPIGMGALPGQILHWFADAQTLGLPIRTSGGTAFEMDMPWFIRDSQPDQIPAPFRFAISTTGPMQAIATMQVISAPPGILPRGRLP